ncbi:hypothetical protein LCGC14_0163220 [marine sediment metagenome]|uniref:Uncharacterized protein n=1 Tax=marine sediment metagenome TaxID=412755 RepID=A0A0F9XWB5_9ZZZZ
MVDCPSRFRWVWELSYILHGFHRPLLWVPPENFVQRTQLQARRRIRKKRIHQQARTAWRWGRRHQKPLFERIKDEIENEIGKLVWQALGVMARE